MTELQYQLIELAVRVVAIGAIALAGLFFVGGVVTFIREFTKPL